MKQLSATQIKLLELMHDGSCHSGNNLGAELGLSRTAIWKQIKGLIELGAPMQTLPQQGYRLTMPVLLLNEEEIRQELLNNQCSLPFNFNLFATLDSTNRFLKELPGSACIEICCAEKQTAGRGRFGRSWHSPFAQNIYCSLRWHFDCDISQLSGLSLVVSLAVLETLQKLDIGGVQIKWPNDLLWDGKKLCGCLIEINAESNGGAEVVIGIGLNSNSTAEEAIDIPWCSLHDMTKQYFNRNQIIGQMIVTLTRYLQEFTRQGFAAFRESWEQADYLQNKMIRVLHPLGPMYGQAQGVNESGQLILWSEGEIHYLSSGDTSLHVE
ncbi:MULTISPECIES: biotin--[acetyl-CoA-carboxylase] ligase [Legionella]|uniref:biotin--[acetyl-CoA-carboxylase] ligase n=1 Tax=Legionella TaxID=445 RepID=UPI000F8C6BB8|nr:MULTISPECIES: biotin--[acetyl-CoA-carboxylase] ligase [Legionella]MCP0914366.1 biotin--[acetyl-CoA-carboxylase] ligase [Legionella sp. 27cVA30]RUR11862.1 biotin--[acetyl-CoA-carboxylase] ligase [Legionella septentrionalis]RUR17549.1 biotin--[acetyl-CoA-carboxylase] ligase [Legionella septentrionalis]